jgi:hypothetical protein
MRRLTATRRCDSRRPKCQSSVDSATHGSVDSATEGSVGILVINTMEMLFQRRGAFGTATMLATTCWGIGLGNRPAA